MPRCTPMAALVVCLACQAALSTQWVQPDDLGIVCLDGQTGRPEWEYFPDRLTPCELATDGKLLYMVMGPRDRRYLMDPIIGANKTRTIKAFDLANLAESADPALPDQHQLTTSACSPRPLILASGDRIAESGNRRVVIMMRGKSDQVRSILPVPWTFGAVYAHGNLVVLTRFDHSQTSKESTYWAVAYDSTSHKMIWALKSTDIDRPWGYAQGAKHLYVLQTGAARALDLDTGTWTWTAPLPRILGFSRAVEHDGRVYVICDYCSGPPSYYLYCLDAASGKLLWTFDPHGTLVNLPLVFHQGKIYTQISPDKLARRLKDRLQTDRDGKSFQSGDHALRYYFADKPSGTVELNLRAWHEFGDRALLPLVVAIGQAIPSSRELARELELSFPSTRDSMRLLRYLEDELNRSPELRGEICRILDDVDPVPFGYNLDTWGFPPRPVPKLEFPAGQHAVVAAYQALRRRAYGPLMGELDTQFLQKLFLRSASASFASLALAFEAAPYDLKRNCVVSAMFALHPGPSADWALEHAQRLTPSQTSCWISKVSPAWLEAHQDLLDTWLRSDEWEIRNSAATRLSDVREAIAAPRYVHMLEQGRKANESWMVFSLRAAILGLARLNRKDCIPLIREYLESPATQPMVFGEDAGVTRQCETYPLREAAVEALSTLGVQVSAVTKGPERLVGTAEQIATREHLLRLRTLREQLASAQNSGDIADARRLASELVTLPPLEGEILDDDRLSKAYEVLENWEKLADCRLRALPGWRHPVLLQQMASKNALGAIELIMKRTDSASTRVEAAGLLVKAGKAETVVEWAHEYLRRDPGDWNACVAKAEAHFALQRVADADAAMELALELLPQASDDSAFQRTITYWLDRDRTDRANAWLKRSVEMDFESWQHHDLLKWAGQYPALQKTLQSVIRARESKAGGMRCAPALTATGCVAVSCLGLGVWLRHRRRSPSSGTNMGTV